MPAVKKKASPVAADTSPDDKIPEAEKTAAKNLLSEINRAKTLTKDFREKVLPQWRRHAWGQQPGATNRGEEAESSVRTNLIFATQATLLPHIYAKNPEISAAPTEAVDSKEYELIKDFCATAQVILNRVFVEGGKLKKRAKSNVRSAMATSVGWLKLGFQESLAGDPLILRRVNDVQDNLRRIEHLATQKDEDVERLQVRREELRQQERALMESNEVKIFKGLVIDRVQTEDILILDESIIDFDDYAHAKKIAHGIWMTDDEYAETFGGTPPTGATQYSRPGESADNPVTNFGDADKKHIFRRVWEVWDHTCNSVFTVCEGGSGYSRPPFSPPKQPERWFPFYALGFNLVEGRWRPLSDIELLKKLEEEYNTTRTLFAEARKEAIPVWVFRKGGNLTEEDITKLSNRTARQWIGVEGNPQVPLKEDILQMPGVEIDPAAYDVTIIRNDMDMLVGLSDASRANLIEAKTATEAEIMRQSLQLRVAERQDSNEDLISEMANDSLEIMLQRFTKDEVMQIAGPEAVWPEMDVQTIFHKIGVAVRAGSTGKPNLEKERESWATIMPILKETVQQVAELRTAGQFDMADSLIELLKETLKRYDERLDIDRFIPRPELDDQGNPIAQQNAIANAEQMQEQMQALTDELTACKEKLLQTEQSLAMAKQNDLEKAASVEATAAITQAQEGAKAAESSAKAATAQADAEAKYAADVEKARIAAASAETMNKDKLAAEERMSTATLANQKAIAQISADGKLKAAKVKKPAGEGGTEGGSEGGTEGGEVAGDAEYNEMAQILQKQGDALIEQTSVLKDMTKVLAKLAADAVPTYDEEGKITKVTRTPT